jgi:predicted dehydrogenase
VSAPLFARCCDACETRRSRVPYCRDVSTDPSPDLHVTSRPLGIGFVGSGFITKFHIQSFRAVRDAEVLGVWSPNRKHAEETAQLARRLDVGACKAYGSIADMVADPNIDAIWLAGPNFARIENVEEIVEAVKRGRGELKGIACEKPLARNVAEAKQVVKMVKGTGIKTGYLESQIFAPHVETGRALLWARGAATSGRPYLARAAEEHSGPHMPWFWQGQLQGGGVLNDMMCHSVEVVRHLLTKPGASRDTVRPVRVTGHIASLKWTRPAYVKRLSKTMGKAVNYAKTPSEDFASCTIEFETEDGFRVFGEATTSWSYVGAGLRLSAECLGPEYSMSWNSLDSGLKVFFSREVRGRAGEDLVEKQNAEMGLMPVVPEEAAAYGYEAENRHFVRVFLGKEEPILTFDDGLEVVRLLMTAYRSAELGRTLDFPPKGLDTYVPPTAKGEWVP